MKIEKINDNQIRCILDKSDLTIRHIKVSELAYGSEKAKLLFKEMMNQASYEFGFEINDNPLMIEAIPVSAECLILIITKVEEPDELDTRFSKFTPDPEFEFDSLSDEEIDSMEQIPEYSTPEADTSNENNVIDLFNKVKEYLSKAVVNPEDLSKKNVNNSSENFIETPVLLTRLYSFESLDSVTKAAVSINSIFNGFSTLYKDSQSKKYYLLIDNHSTAPVIFNKVCNILNEFGNKENGNFAAEIFVDEHYEVIIKENAVQKLSLIN